MKQKVSLKEKIFGTGLIQYKAVEKAKEDKETDGTFSFVASGIKVDRYGEIVDPNGWDFKAFKKNPVMLWGHNHSIPAIAQVTKIWKDEKQVYCEAKWAPTEFAQELRLLVEGGFIRSVSVGFMPRQWEGEWPNYKYIDQELLEISVVNVPAYAEALISEAKSLGLKSVVKAFEAIPTKDTPTKKETPTGKDKGTEKDAPSVIAMEHAEDGVVLHFDDLSRKHFALGEEANLDSLVESVAKQKNVILFTQDELEAFKKEMSEPIPAALNSKLISFGEKLLEVTASLQALTATSEKGADEGRQEEVQVKAKEVDPAEMLRIADKAIEAALLTMRKDSKKK